jgi:hypothetical protein
MSIILILFGVATLKLIKNDSKETKPKTKDEVYSLTKEVIKAAKSNKNILIGWVIIMFCGGPMVIFEIYIMNWL